MNLLQALKSLDKADWIKIGSGLAIALGAVGTGGYFVGSDEPAICLDSPFSMRLACGGSTNDFERLILTEDPALGNAEKGRRYLRLRHVRTAFEIEPVGVIVAQNYKQSSKASLIDSLNAITNAEAAEPFSWNGHDQDNRFRERQDKSGEIIREYADGCVLGYQNDANGKSIPASFRWIRKTHQ